VSPLCVSKGQAPLLFIDNTKHGSGHQAIIVTAVGLHLWTDRAGSRGAGLVEWRTLFSTPIVQTDKHNIDVGENHTINLGGASL
jgi:hypothetical protein